MVVDSWSPSLLHGESAAAAQVVLVRVVRRGVYWRRAARDRTTVRTREATAGAMVTASDPSWPPVFAVAATVCVQIITVSNDEKVRFENIRC